MLYEAFLNTIELWVVLAIMLVALVAEEGWKWVNNRNEELQLRIDAEIDRLHK